MPHHDSLCITTTRDEGMTACWCMCADCWHNEGSILLRARLSEEERDKPENKRPKGRCICRACPCQALLGFGQLALPVPRTMPSPPPPPPPPKRVRAPRKAQPRAGTPAPARRRSTKPPAGD
jgi:hypothetical protein